MAIWGRIKKIAEGVYEDMNTGQILPWEESQRWLNVGKIYSARRGKIAERAQAKDFSVLGVQDVFGIDEDEALQIIDGFTNEYEEWLKGGQVGSAPVLYERI